MVDGIVSVAFEPVFHLSVALAVGLLIGLERGWQRRALPEGARVAGVRTFGLIGLIGGVLALAVSETGIGDSLLVGGMVVLGAIIVSGYWRGAGASGDLSITTAVSAILTFALGALAGLGLLVPAATAAVVVALLLGIKPELHTAMRRLDRVELLASLRLLMISVVVLPFLPDRGFGPWEALNPYALWWMVVIVAALSYVGYFAIRIAGERLGVVVTALLGGLASSTAVALTMAKLGRDQPSRQPLYAAATVLASAMMFPRLLVIIAVFAPTLLRWLGLPLAATGIVALVGAAWQVRRATSVADSGDVHLPGNPLDLRLAVQFVLLLALVMLAARGAHVWFGDVGLYVLAALSGLTDVDAITLSLGTMAERDEAPSHAVAIAVMIAAAVNSAVKPGLVAAIAGPGMAARIAITLGLSLSVGVTVLWIQP